MQNTIHQSPIQKEDIEKLKAEAKELLETVAQLQPEDRRVVLAALKGMVIALDK